jgi:hypothetical protein
MTKKVFDRLAEGIKEAAAIANGEIPAASIFVNGHRYVPMEEYARLRSALSAAEAEIERLTEKAIVGEYMWTPVELGEAVATARKEALEDAINAVKSAAPRETGEWSVHRAWALGALPALEQMHSAAIRSLAENTEGDKP